jgi:predicted MPP superfamily phosphohydrolase
MKHWIRILTLLLSLFSILSLVACNGDEGKTADTAPKDTEDTPTNEEESTAMPTDSLKEKNYRVILSSDVHYTYLEAWYGWTSEDRMQHWVDSIIEEHKKNPVDLVIIAGDTSLDHWASNGSYTKDKISTTETFVKNYISQLPEEIEVFVSPGNHEQFNDEQWLKLTGNRRQGSVALGNNLFVMLDTFSQNLEPNYKGNPLDSPADVAFVKSEMAKHPECKNVYLVAHYFHTGVQSEEFKALLKDSRVRGLFQGHTHQSSIVTLGAEFGGKKIAQTGNFSYTGESASADAVKNSFWGFRELIITPESAISSYIVTRTRIVIDGKEIVSLNRTLTHRVRFY